MTVDEEDDAEDGFTPPPPRSSVHLDLLETDPISFRNKSISLWLSVFLRDLDMMVLLQEIIGRRFWFRWIVIPLFKW